MTLNWEYINEFLKIFDYFLSDFSKLVEREVIIIECILE